MVSHRNVLLSASDQRRRYMPISLPCLLVWCCLRLATTSAYAVNVKIVNDSVVNRNANYGSLKSAKGEPTPYAGPQELRYLLGKCFIYSADKYDYRVCPFHNVTQHERVWTSGGTAYNGIIGLWKEWTVTNHSFDALVYYGGDDCGKGVERSARLLWVCSEAVSGKPVERVVGVKELRKCFYEISLAAEFGCREDKHIYRHLSEEFRRKWDQLESNLYYSELTQFGYEWALRELFVDAGILLNTTHHSITTDDGIEDNFDTKEQCFDSFVEIKAKNLELIKRIEILEIQLNTNKTFSICLNSLVITDSVLNSLAKLPKIQYIRLFGPEDYTQTALQDLI
ncbi:unnamed protein product [Oppiella nova]|uniref:MRH domain-containing protein n=1 Tax=Oppiella nova TaxID=334625 RepID=A0A7R9QP84_9ACAR|nr:unnamed protein product [Oppiella nova]CAG2170546.1 unnamed protein product [Oppiella nova]